jgi:hypothetical protein
MVRKPSSSVFLAKSRKDVVSAGGWSHLKLRVVGDLGQSFEPLRHQAGAGKQKLGNKIH